MYIYKERFYSQLEYIREALEQGETAEVELCTLEFIVVINGDYIVDRIDEERFSEEFDIEEREEIAKILNDNIDWDKINLLLPKIYYPNGKKITIIKD